MKKFRKYVYAAAAALTLLTSSMPAAAAEDKKINIVEKQNSWVAEVDKTVSDVQAELKKIKKEQTAVSRREAILNAAYAQIGVNQDCTMLVTNSLRAVGINHHSAPEGYAVLGDWTNDPQPGDIIIYSGHVAIYAGPGKAVHGGWNGYTTIEGPIACSNPLIGYIRVRV